MSLTLMKVSLCFALLGAVAASRDRNNHPHKVVCYWGSWSSYRNGDDKFGADQIDASLCTHLNYAFAKLENNKIHVEDQQLDDGQMHKMNGLRNKNKHLTTLISIGGWSEGSTKYSHMVSNANSRKEFVHSVLDFLHKYDFDGLDIDWEYPTMNAEKDGERSPGRTQDKNDYITLLKELHDAFKPHGYLLTAAVGAGSSLDDRAYNIPEMSKYLDYINLMTYDFHGEWEHKTGHNAPLFPYQNSSKSEKDATVSHAVEYWIHKGAPSHKLVMGVPFYGHGFTLSTSAHGIGAPVSGPGKKSDDYYKLCQMFKSGWHIYRDNIQKIPYAVSGNQWIGFDDKQSIEEKMKYLVSKNLGGAMIWSIESDDFHGHCGSGKFPLLRTISKHLNHVG